MTNSLSIAVAQINQRVGDLKANAEAMLAWRQKAVAQADDVEQRVSLLKDRTYKHGWAAIRRR